MNGFRPEDLTELIHKRQVVRIALMRSTIHAVSAADCLALRPLLQPVLERALRGTFGKRLAGMKLALVAAAAEKLLAAQPRSFGELGALLAERWPDRDPAALAYTARALLPMVQIPPRGVWGSGGNAVHLTAQAWLGQPLNSKPSVEKMILRYLAAFGPASVRDMQSWSGLTGLGEIVEPLRPHLRAFRDKRGQELLDLPDAPRPDPDTPAPPRFLPVFDNALLAHADRGRILNQEHRSRLFSTAGLLLGSLLLDGFVSGRWKIALQGNKATLTIEPFRPLRKQEREALNEEGARLLAFAAPAAAFTISISKPL